MARRFFVCFVVCPFLLLLAGCGSSGNVAGKAYLGDKLFSKGKVYFHGQGNVVVSGDVDADGNYSVVGVPVGKAKIVVTAASGFTSNDPKAPKAPWIPQQYLDLKKSPLSFDVKKGDNTFDIKMSGK